jgi:hypothetical protein
MILSKIIPDFESFHQKYEETLNFFGRQKRNKDAFGSKNSS